MKSSPISPSERDNTFKALDDGTLTNDEALNGWYVSRNGKKKQLKEEQFKNMELGFQGFQVQKENKANVAQKKEAEKKAGVNKSAEQKQAGVSKSAEQKQDAASASKDAQKVFEDAANFIDTKTTTKVSPFFWKNINYILENDKYSAYKEKDPAKQQYLIKQLKAKKAELYADHILKSLANLALSTSNWTGAEAGHNPKHNMVTSQADIYKNAQNRAYANQIEKIGDFNVAQQTSRAKAINDALDSKIKDQMNASWAQWSNDSRFKDAKGKVDYYKMLDNLDVDERVLLENFMKQQLINLDNKSSMKDVAEALGGYKLGPMMIDLLNAGAELTGKGIQGGVNLLKDKLGI